MTIGLLTIRFAVVLAAQVRFAPLNLAILPEKPALRPKLSIAPILAEFGLFRLPESHLKQSRCEQSATRKNMMATECRIFDRKIKGIRCFQAAFHRPELTYKK